MWSPAARTARPGGRGGRGSMHTGDCGTFVFNFLVSGEQLTLTRSSSFFHIWLFSPGGPRVSARPMEEIKQNKQNAISLSRSGREQWFDSAAQNIWPGCPVPPRPGAALSGGEVTLKRRHHRGPAGLSYRLSLNKPSIPLLSDGRILGGCVIILL